MEGFVITSKGLEDAAAAEIKEILNADCKIEETCARFNLKSFEDLCSLCYKCQSIDKAALLLGNLDFEDFLKESEEFIESLDLGSWFKNNKKFKVECIRRGNHNFKSTDVELNVCNLILKKFKAKKIKFDAKDYEIIFLIYIVDNKCYFGIDFAGIDLNKRAYKIFLHSNSLRGTIAYALIRESGFRKSGVLLDPFCKDGVIAIESALYASGVPVNYFNKEKFAFLKLKVDAEFEKVFKKIDKKAKKTKLNIYSYDHLFKHIDYSRKNAKIAGVDKYINFSRVELEWLDIKFKKESVDVIITSMPTSKNANLDKIYNEFFYQSEYILKKDGRIAIVSRAPDLALKHASKHNFIILKEREVWSGEQMLKIVVFEKIMAFNLAG